MSDTIAVPREEYERLRPFMDVCVAIDTVTWERVMQLLSATTMMLESAEFKDEEDAAVALDVRLEAEAYLKSVGRIT